MGSTYRARHSAPRPARGRLRSTAAGTAATLVLGGLAVAVQLPAANAEEICTKKCYSAVVAPQSSVASTSVPFTVTLANLDAQRLGSADITPPAGYSVTSTPTTTRGAVLLVGGVVQLRNAEVPEGASVVVSFTGTTPATAGIYTWAVVAKQANEFHDASGTGNLLAMDRALSDLTTAVTAAPTNITDCRPTTTYSCAKKTIDYSQDSVVSTGADADSVKKVVGRIFLSKTSSVGTQDYEIYALRETGTYCPLGDRTVKCTFDFFIDDVPTQYAGFQVTLEIECDVTQCPSGDTLASMTMLNEQTGEKTPLLPCGVAGNGDKCFVETRQGDGDRLVTVRNLKPGDPRIAGVMVGPESPPNLAVIA